MRDLVVFMFPSHFHWNCRNCNMFLMDWLLLGNKCRIIYICTRNIFKLAQLYRILYVIWIIWFVGISELFSLILRVRGSRKDFLLATFGSMCLGWCVGWFYGLGAHSRSTELKQLEPISRDIFELQSYHDSVFALISCYVLIDTHLTQSSLSPHNFCRRVLETTILPTQYQLSIPALATMASRHERLSQWHDIHQITWFYKGCQDSLSEIYQFRNW